jgi:molybdopterin molybdotransferase
VLSVFQARQIIFEKSVEKSAEFVALEHARGRTLAGDVLATEDSPAFDRSTMDGYALAFTEGIPKPPEFAVVMSIQAGGTPPGPLKSGQAARIFTGAEVPEGATRVVPQEWVRVNGDRITIEQWPEPLHVRRRGEEHRRGDVLLKRGQRLGPFELSVLAAEGVVQPTVQIRPRVLHVVTGDELIAPGAPLGRGQIRDSNSALIAALVEKAGGEMIGNFHFKDDLDHMLTTLQAFPEDRYDVLLVSGGASVGEHDWTRPLLRKLGFLLEFEQVNVRPGKPLIFAQKGERIAFGLPGNPVSHAVCFHLFVQMAFSKVLGLPFESGYKHAVMESPLSHSAEPREAYWPCRLLSKEGTTFLQPVRWTSSGHMAALVGVEAFLRLPQGVGDVAQGEVVEYLEIT